MAFLGSVLWGSVKLAVKYVAVPVAITLVTAMAADALAQRMKARTEGLEGGEHTVQAPLDYDPALRPAP